MLNRWSLLKIVTKNSVSHCQFIQSITSNDCKISWQIICTDTLTCLTSIYKIHKNSQSQFSNRQDAFSDNCLLYFKEMAQSQYSPDVKFALLFPRLRLPLLLLLLLLLFRSCLDKLLISTDVLVNFSQED